MKLNAAALMQPLSLAGFQNMHPFAPADQTEGYRELIDGLAADLATITGFAACSLMPNSGAAGEYTGLMVIRAYHQSRGQGYRNIVLIPSSAHGTIFLHGVNHQSVGTAATQRFHQCGW